MVAQTQGDRDDARLTVAVGVMVYNEAANLDRLLHSLVSTQGPHLDIHQIIVVSSGSTDSSSAMARRWQHIDPRVTLIDDPERRGKATAINQFLEQLDPAPPVVLLTGGDLVPSPEALDALVKPFADPRVGVTGAHPVPTNQRDSLLNRAVHAMWDLHHEVATRTPKMGEIIAFRPELGPLDPTTAVDEAWIESAALAAGLRLVYVAEAVVYNRGPERWREFLQQRRRIRAGHVWLQRRRDYSVSTLRLRALLRPALESLVADPTLAPALAAAASVEAVARVLASWDVRILHHEPTIWERLDSTKRP